MGNFFTTNTLKTPQLINPEVNDILTILETVDPTIDTDEPIRKSSSDVELPLLTEMENEISELEIETYAELSESEEELEVESVVESVVESEMEPEMEPEMEQAVEVPIETPQCVESKMEEPVVEERVVEEQVVEEPIETPQCAESKMEEQVVEEQVVAEPKLEETTKDILSEEEEPQITRKKRKKRNWAK